MRTSYPQRYSPRRHCDLLLQRSTSNGKQVLTRQLTESIVYLYLPLYIPIYLTSQQVH